MNTLFEQGMVIIGFLCRVADLVLGCRSNWSYVGLGEVLHAAVSGQEAGLNKF